MVLPQPVTVTAELLAWLVRTESLGELHTVLTPVARWLPRAARAELETTFREELGKFGPLDRRGRLDVEVLASLAALCRATTEFYGWIDSAQSTKGVLAATIGSEAILAVRDGKSVWLSQVSRHKLANVLVAQTPDVPAARGDTVTVTRAEALATSGGRQRTPGSVILHPASPRLRLIQRITALPTTGSGELYVATRDSVGRRRKVDQPLRYADTARGRFLNQVTVTGGETRVRVAPASTADLVARLEEMRRSVLR